MTKKQRADAVLRRLPSYEKLSPELLKELQKEVDDMTRIPLGIQALTSATASPRELQKVLIAAILAHQATFGEDEPFVLKEEFIKQADRYTMVVTDFPDEQALVLNVRLR